MVWLMACSMFGVGKRVLMFSARNVRRARMMIIAMMSRLSSFLMCELQAGGFLSFVYATKGLYNVID